MESIFSSGVEFVKITIFHPIKNKSLPYNCKVRGVFLKNFKGYSGHLTKGKHFVEVRDNNIAVGYFQSWQH